MIRKMLLSAVLAWGGASTVGAETLDGLVDKAMARTAAGSVRPASGVNSTAASEYNLSRSADGRLQVFARSGPAFAGSKIYVSERTGAGMGDASPIAFSDPRWRDSDPWLTPDGLTLYFVSDRPTAARPNKTDLDVWRSRRTDAGWSPPEHLGDIVNGRGEELGPEVHDGRLYFATARRSGLGGLDVYAAPAQAQDFGRPELLPAPINSAASESDFTLSPDGKTALFWRLVDGKGLLHAAQRTAAGWSTPAPLNPAVNFGGFNFTPAFSADGRAITFASAPNGEAVADVFEVARP